MKEQQLPIIKKKILVLGASSGMGRALASYYAREGHQVLAIARRKELLDNLQLEFPEIFTAVMDITVMHNWDGLEALAEKLGGMDLFIFCAGGGQPSEQLEWEFELETFQQNLPGFLSSINWAFQYFIRHDGGHIAGISSISARRGNTKAPAYSASKAFQSNYLEALYWKARNNHWPIHVTCIEPGFVATGKKRYHPVFWEIPVEKACEEIVRAIYKKRKRVVITAKWKWIGWFLKFSPGWLLYRIVK